MSILFLPAAILLFDGPKDSSRNAPINGDTRLLEVLRDTQRLNSEQVSKGALTAEVEFHTDTGSGSNYGSKCRTECLWNGEDYRLDLSGTYDAKNVRITPRGGMTAQGDSHSERHIIFTRSGNRFLQYTPGGRQARLNDASLEHPHREALVRPEDWWFGQIGGERRPFFELLGPHPNVPQDGVRDYRITLLDRDRIEMLRSEKSGAFFRAVASLAAGGNIVSFERSDPPLEYSWTANYLWEQDGKGRNILRSCESTFRFGKSLSRASYKLISIDLDSPLRPGSFVTDPRSLPRGTFVDDRFARRSYRVGQSDPGAMLDRLDALIRVAM
jgi:hypothetical protein